MPAPFEPSLFPGEAPVLAANPTALAVSIHNSAWNAWKFEMDQFRTQQKELFDFKVSLLASLDAASFDLMNDPVHGTKNISVDQIDARLIMEYGILSPSDLSAIEATLLVPFQVGSNLRQYTNAHRRVHAVSELNGQLISEANKVKHLISGLTPCGLFQPCIDLCTLQNPTIALQLFAALVTAVHAFAATRNNMATTATEGFVAAVISPQFDDSMFDFRAAAAVAAILKTKPAQRTQLYCWSHGVCGHTSKDCN